jgi:uncharacterized protein
LSVRRVQLIPQGLAAAAIGLTVLAILLASQRYWFVQGWKFAARRKPELRKLLRLVIVVWFALLALVVLNELMINLRGRISLTSRRTIFLGLWTSSSMVAYLFVKFVAGAEWIYNRLRPPAVSGKDPAGATDPARRQFFRVAGVVAGTVPFATVFYGFAAERLRFEVSHVEISVANLPVELDGLRIAQLSDIHVSSYMPLDQVRRAVGMTNELAGDLVVITGDNITGRTDPLAGCIAELSKLRAPLGVWGCNGNHEIYAQAEAASAKLFSQFGMRLLRHENAELRWHGASFTLIGVDYQRQQRLEGEPSPMLRGVDALVRHDIPNILLSHNPNSFPRAAELGIELSLAGHTHGGQVRVEILDHRWSPARFLTPFTAGLYQRPLFTAAQISQADANAPSPTQPASRIYVNRGLGTIGAPVRLFDPPEITLLTLRRA